jgi:hypothetical protein
VQALHVGGFRLAADAPVVDLHMRFDGPALELRAADPPARLRLQGDILAKLAAIRLNGREWPITPGADATIVIDGGQWTAADATQG